MKPFSEKVKQSVQNYWNQNLVIGRFLENGFEATLSSKTNVVSVWKDHFSVFANFLVRKLKPFPGKVSQTVQNYFNQTLVIGNFLENGFQATLSWKANVLSAYKCHFSVFSKALRDKIPTFFSKPERKRSELSKSKLAHMNLLEKWFWSYLELKKECCERLKRSFFSFSTFLSDEVEAIFWERRQSV